MDLSFVKNQLETSQNKKQSKTYEKIDYTKIFWKPKPGKYTVRILPNQFREEWPLREVYIHYGLKKWSILALTNWSESDPVVDFVKELRRSKDKEDWSLASKLSPKARYFMPVFVREEPQAGVRLWEVGKTVNETLMGIAADEDYGDFTDIMNGRDFTVEAYEDTVANKKVTKCNIRPKPKTSPISQDAELIEKLLKEQPDVLSFNRKYNYDSLKEILQEYLNPEPVASEETSESLDNDNDDEEDDLPFDKDLKDKVKRNPSDAFDELFKK